MVDVELEDSVVDTETVQQEWRTVLCAEGVFSSAGSADLWSLCVMWSARESPEYHRRLAELHDR